MSSIMVVEDDVVVATILARTLVGLGYPVAAVVDSGEEAILRAAEVRPDLALMDMVLTGSLDGVDTAHILRERFGIPVVYLTAHDDSPRLERAKATGPFGYLVKPFEGRELRSTIEMALHKRRGEAEREASERALAASRGELEELIETMPEPMVIVQEGQLMYVNRAWAACFGYDNATELIGRPFADLTGPGQPKLAPTPHAEPQWRARRFTKRSGGPLILEIAMAALGRFHHLPATLVVARDVTARRRHHDTALREAGDALASVLTTVQQAARKVAGLAPARATSPAPLTSAGPAHPRGRLLIIDDEPLVASTIRRVLATQHDTVIVHGAVAGLAQLVAGERFDVILCDLMMAEMSGVDFHAELQRRSPADAARIVFLTGGAYTDEARRFLAGINNPRFNKPLDFAGLRALVHERVAAGALPAAT